MIDYRLEHISMFALRIGVFIEVSPCMSCARISNQPRVLALYQLKFFEEYVEVDSFTPFEICSQSNMIEFKAI